MAKHMHTLDGKQEQKWLTEEQSSEKPGKGVPHLT